MWIGCPAPPGARSVEASRAIVAQVEAEWTAHLGSTGERGGGGVSDEVRRLRGRYLPIAE